MHYYPAGQRFVRVMKMCLSLIQNLFSSVVATPHDLELEQITHLHLFLYSFRYIIRYI